MIGILLGIAGVTAAVLASLGLHVVTEGHRGVYFRAGLLLNTTTSPGLHVQIPILDRHEQIQITQQVDEIAEVNNIACGTSGGVTISFDRVEVVNQLDKNSVIKVVREFGTDYDQPLIFQKLHSEINQFCSRTSLREVLIERFDELDELLRDRLQLEADKYASGGLKIIAVRVTKPRLPKAIERDFLEMEVQKAQVLVAQQKARVMEIEAQTDRLVAKIHAEKESDISSIQNQRRIMEREALRNVSRIDDTILLSRAKAQSESEAYRLELLAKANQALLTPSYLQLRHIEAMGNTSKVFFGERLPSFYVDKSGGGAAHEAAALHLGAP